MVQPPFLTTSLHFLSLSISLSLSLSAFRSFSLSLSCSLDSFTINNSTSTFCRSTGSWGFLLFFRVRHSVHSRRTILGTLSATAMETATGTRFDDDASHSIANETHEASIVLLANVDAPVTSERTCDHPRSPTDDRAATDRAAPYALPL